MLETLRRAVPVAAVPIDGLVAAVTLGAFVWLLAYGYVQPIAVYLLELFLTF